MTYGYLRVSTDKQDENNQKSGVEEKARKMGIAIDEYIIDAGVSGTKEPEKRKLGTLLEKLKSGDMIIASELSRLGRSLYMVMRILEYCMKHDVKVITVKDNYELGDNVQSKVLAFAFALAAEIERDMISQRTKEALAVKVKGGLKLGRPVGSKSGKKLTPYCEEIKNLLEKGMSLSAIGRMYKVHRMTVATFCEEQGLISREYGKTFTGGIAPKQTRPKHDNRKFKKLLLEGKGYKEIAAQLGISKGAAHNYISRNAELYGVYVQKQTEIRIASNGGMRIHKKHGAAL